MKFNNNDMQKNRKRLARRSEAKHLTRNPETFDALTLDICNQTSLDVE